MAQITITYPDALEPILQRAQAEHGVGVATDLLVNWLQDRALNQREADGKIRQAKYDALPANRRKAVDDLLV